MSDKNIDYDLERYRLLHGLIHHESDRYWTKFNIFLVLTSVVLNITFLVFIYDIAVNPPVLCLLLGFGIALSGMWLVINARSRAYIECWMEDAKLIESYYQTLDIFTRGKERLKKRKWYVISAMLLGIIISFGFIVVFIGLLVYVVIT